jgi:hypothetical protein
MSRPLYSAVVALLVLGMAVSVWLVFKARHPGGRAVVASQSLSADAATLASMPGKWQSEVVSVTLRDGKVYDQILGLEFGPGTRAGQSNAPDAQVKLFTTSPIKGIPGVATVGSSLGDGSFRDVRLREEHGVRTITITRAVPANDPNPAKTQLRFDRLQSISFRYELKKNVLTLNGFPTTNKVRWGVSEFVVPQEEIKFKVGP